MSHSLKFLFCFSLIGILQACQTSAPVEPTAQLRWYSSCGAPVCGNPNQVPGSNTCGDKQEGQLCQQAGATCDLGNDCNQNLICAESDPKLEPGGCPISQAEFKREIHYLSAAEREQLTTELMRLPLASWQYKHEPQGPRRLGFIIEDKPPQEALRPDGTQVDLYGYMSVSVAALQSQSDKIKALEARLTQLEKNCTSTH